MKCHKHKDRFLTIKDIFKSYKLELFFFSQHNILILNTDISLIFITDKTGLMVPDNVHTIKDVQFYRQVQSIEGMLADREKLT